MRRVSLSRRRRTPLSTAVTLLTVFAMPTTAYAMRILIAEPSEAPQRKPAEAPKPAPVVSTPKPTIPAPKDGAAKDPEEPVVAGKSPSTTPVKDAGAPGPFTVQVGTYQSIRRAQILRSTLENIGPSRIDEIQGDHGEPMYRVLVGKFKSSQEAREFSDRHFFPKLFPRVWVHPVADMSGVTSSSSDLNTKLLDDPYLVQVNLHCQDGRRRGTQMTTIRPEPELRGSEVDIAVNWNCYLDAPESFHKRDEELRPSHVFLTPELQTGTLKGAQDSQRSEFSYGGEIGAFRNFGAFGAGLGYRLLNRRFTGTPDLLDFALDNTLRTWVSIHFRENFSITPEFEFRKRPMLITGLTSGALEYYSTILPAVSLRADIELLNIGERTRIYLTPRYQLIGTSTSDGITISTGTSWYVELRTHSAFQERVAGEWFARYGAISQPTSAGNQSETQFTFGFSILWVDP